MMTQEEQYYHPIEGLPRYGLKQGDRLKISVGAGYIEDPPDFVEVIEELDKFILCSYCYKHWMGFVTSYRHCLNKHDIVTGAIKFKKER